MPADQPEITRVEAACADLAAAGQPVTFKQVAARARVSRTTRYRRPDLRAVIDDHRAPGSAASNAHAAPDHGNQAPGHKLSTG